MCDMHDQDEYRQDEELTVTEPSADAQRAARRAGILAGLTIVAFVVSAVATGSDPTPTVVSFA